MVRLERVEMRLSSSLTMSKCSAYFSIPLIDLIRFPLAWNSFAYQPYFSATASNVGYGFWSHDIEGPGDDHELCATPIPQLPTSAFFVAAA